MVGTLRSVETNAKGCAGGVRAELFDGTDSVVLSGWGSAASPVSSPVARFGCRAARQTLENGAKASTTRTTRSSVEPPDPVAAGPGAT